jgi:hypothetical protein
MRASALNQVRPKHSKTDKQGDGIPTRRWAEGPANFWGAKENIDLLISAARKKIPKAVESE